MKEEEKELEARIAWRNRDRGVSQRVTRGQEGHGGKGRGGRGGTGGRGVPLRAGATCVSSRTRVPGDKSHSRRRSLGPKLLRFSSLNKFVSWCVRSPAKWRKLVLMGLVLPPPLLGY